MKDKLKTICYVFHMVETHMWLSLFHFSWSFMCVLFHVITWLLSFFYWDYVFHDHVLSSLISALNALHRWSRLWWCMSPQKLFFSYHLPTRGRAGVKLGDGWYVSNVSIIFDAPCLFYTICFMFCYTLWHFYAFSGTNLLTRCHSASSLFSDVFVFRKVTRDIFSELDETKAEPPNIYLSFQKTEEETEGGHGPATP
jgi:hypothetical protein